MCSRKFKRIKEKERGVSCTMYRVTTAPAGDPGTAELFLPQTPAGGAAPSSPGLFVKCSQLLRESTMQQAEFCCSSPLVTDTGPLRPLSSFRGCSHYPQSLEMGRRNRVFRSHNAESPITVFSCDCVWESAHNFAWKYIQLNENNHKIRVLFCQHILTLFSAKKSKPCCFEYSSYEHESPFFCCIQWGERKHFEGKSILPWQKELKNK